MRMSKWIGVAGVALALTGCGGGEKKQEAAVEEAPATLAAGLYEMSAEVTQLTSVGKAPPATKLKQGDKVVTRACVSADGKPEPELFAEAGDKCQLKSSYVRNGRMSAEMSCTREGYSGGVMPAMNGSFTKDGFEGEIESATYFVEDGDYRMTRKVTAKRIGDCPAGGAAKTS